MAARECERISAELSAHLDRELDEHRSADVERHLGDCDHCRALLADLRAVADRLAQLPRVAAPEELTAAMRRAAERRELLGTRKALRRIHPLILFGHLSASAAVIAACIFVGWRVLQRPIAAGPAPRGPGVVAVPETPEPKTEYEADIPTLVKRDDHGNGDAVIDALEEAKRGAGRGGKSAAGSRGRGKGPARAEIAEPPDVADKERVAGATPAELAEAADESAAEDLGWVQSGSPIVEIVVRPRDDGQWATAYRLLSLWEPAPQGGEGGFAGAVAREIRHEAAKPVIGAAEAEAAFAAAAAPRRIAVEFQVPAGLAGELIQEFERGAPEQVSARLAFRASQISMWQMLAGSDGGRWDHLFDDAGGAAGRVGRRMEEAPMDAARAQAEKEVKADVSDAEKPVRERRARIVLREKDEDDASLEARVDRRQPKKAVAATEAVAGQPEEAESIKRPAAGGRRAAPDGEAPRATPASRVARDAGPPALEQKAQLPAARRRGGALTPDRVPASQPRAARLGTARATRGARRLWGPPWDDARAAANRLGQEGTGVATTRAVPPSVRFRVTLLPPLATPTTMPASAPHTDAPKPE